MGSPEFAAHSLRQLIKDGFNVVGVITGPDRKSGRGQKLQESAVKQCALEFKLPVFQPTNLKNEDFRKRIEALQPDLGVVVAFRMLPESVWNLPELGTINLHASLLPNYRGAAPINWAVINGEKETGITTFFLKHEIDTGDILLQKSVQISEEMNAGKLHDLLMQEGALLLSETVKQIESESYELIDQSKLMDVTHALKKAPKIFKDDCRINWHRSMQEVYNFIRGLSPHPGAWSRLLTLNGKEYTFKIYSSEKSEMKNTDHIGNLLIKEDRIYVGCSDFYLELKEVQLEGKKRMSAAAFIRGFETNGIQLN